VQVSTGAAAARLAAADSALNDASAHEFFEGRQSPKDSSTTTIEKALHCLTAF
jgi:hypothetical protein